MSGGYIRAWLRLPKERSGLGREFSVPHAIFRSSARGDPYLNGVRPRKAAGAQP